MTYEHSRMGHSDDVVYAISKWRRLGTMVVQCMRTWLLKISRQWARLAWKLERNAVGFKIREIPPHKRENQQKNRRDRNGGIRRFCFAAPHTCYWWWNGSCHTGRTPPYYSIPPYVPQRHFQGNRSIRMTQSGYIGLVFLLVRSPPVADSFSTKTCTIAKDSFTGPRKSSWHTKGMPFIRISMGRLSISGEEQEYFDLQD